MKTSNKIEKPIFKVAIVEYERGWGSKVEDVHEFKSYTKAEKFVEKFNSRNTAKVAPDYYVQAERLYHI